MGRKKKDKKKGEPKWYHRTEWKNGERVYVLYRWEQGEKEEYEKTCLLVSGWCGIPMDVIWAKGTNSYQEALKTNYITIDDGKVRDMD